MKLTLLALRTCSRLEGSIPSPEHETKTKSVSCPVCDIFTCRTYIRMRSIINITAVKNINYLDALLSSNLGSVFLHWWHQAEQDPEKSNGRMYVIQLLVRLFRNNTRDNSIFGMSYLNNIDENMSIHDLLQSIHKWYLPFSSCSKLAGPLAPVAFYFFAQQIWYKINWWVFTQKLKLLGWDT